MTEDNHAGIARSRSCLYAFLTEAFIRLPGDDFLKRISSHEIRNFLNHYSSIGQKQIAEGIGKILNYSDEIKVKKQTDVIRELAVDRTALLRPAGRDRLKAPYEGLYKRKEDSHTTILRVKQFYRKTGKLPQGYTEDSPDFLCTELEFMRQLCLLEAGAIHGREKIRSMENDFLNRHLCSWAIDYCRTAGKYAKTGFYRGLLLFLEGFLSLESDTIETEETDECWKI